jgi:rhamnogalacturonan endolyase
MQQSPQGTFGITDTGAAFVVDTGAGLVFQVNKSNGDITSIVFNGVEYIATSGKFAQISSGLGTATVTPETDGSTFVKLALQTGTTGTADPNLTHYLIVRNGDNTIYMATFPGQEPNVGELRWITRLNHDLLPNGPEPSNLNNNTGAIESSDIFGLADGETRSKYYGDTVTHGKDRAIDLTFSGATGAGVGVWMVFGNRESSSGGPFFRDIENQAGQDQEIYNYMNSGHNQTEPDRLNVLHGPYALVFTTGAPPSLPIDFSWIGNLNLMGWVPDAGRGAVSGTASGVPAGFQGVVGFANDTAQYWASVGADGTYSCPGMKPGTYAATLYKGELGVATDSAIVTAGTTTTLNLTSTETTPSTVFRIGEWDGTPAGFLNSDKIVQMHPSDVRMSPWNVTTFTAGVDDPSTFPAIQLRGKNSPTTIRFNLAPNQLTNLTFKIGITCAYNGGRPSVTINGQSTTDPPASNQPNSRSFTIGTYRGNNTLFTYTLPAGSLVVGMNTLTINPISGSTDLGTWLSAGWVYDAVELDGPIATPVITYVGGNPLVISGTSEPGRNIALTLDGASPAGGTVASSGGPQGGGTWSITYNMPLASGPHSFTAVATDNAGHSSPASDPYSFNTGIITPVIVSAVGDSGTVNPSGATTSDRTFIFSGTAGAGDTVILTRQGTGVIGTIIAAADGTWTFDYTAVALPAGTNGFFVTSSNGGGISPSSSIFTLNIQGPPRITIVRFNPATSTITAGVTGVVFRVTFSSTVSGVSTSAFVLTTSGTASGTVTGVSATSGTIFDVSVGSLSGTGSMRLDLKPGNGIVDSGGNPEPPYHAGDSYTLVLPTTGNGTWIQPASGGLWSDSANWQNAVIADGAGNTADFSTLDITSTNTVHLDSPRTLAGMIFGDKDATTPASWVIDNGGMASNSIALAGTTPTITTNGLGAGANATIAASLTGTGGLNKAGPGTLVLGAPNLLSGPLNLTGGFLQLAPGGSLSLGNSAVSLGLNARLMVEGGSFSTAGQVSAATGQMVTDNGTASIGSFRTNSDFSAALIVNGGSLTVGDVNIRRNSGASPDFTSGFVISGGSATVSTIGLGTQNSYGAMSIQGGSLTATGAVTIANQTTSGRGGAMRVTGNGTFTSTDAALGILMCRTNGSNANNVASATFPGGLSTIEKFTLGFDSTVTSGSAAITINGGTVYLGSGGIIKNGAPGLVTNLNFSSGLLGAKADWSTSLPIVLPTGGHILFKSADSGGAAHDITLNGVLSGAGGFTKSGAGRLVLAGASTFAGAVAVNSGALQVDGGLGAGGDINVNSGATLTGSGSNNRNVMLNSGATIQPGGSATPNSTLTASSLTWNGGAAIAFNLDSSANQLAVLGALTKGGPGSYNFAFTTGSGLAIGNTYTLVNFGSTNFAATDFSFSGLPAGLTGAFTVTPGSVVFRIFGPPVIATQPESVTVLMGGTATFSVAVNPTPSPTYQWLKDGSPIAGATGASLTIANVQAADIGSYTVVISNPAGSTASSAANLSIAPTALVNHAPVVNGLLAGSIQQMLGESLTFNSSAAVAGNLLVPGTPNVVLNGSPNYGGTLDGSGSPDPSNYSVTLNSGAALGHLVRRTDPVSLPVVSAPAPPGGTHSVTINSSSQSVGDWTTVRNLTLNSNVGQIAVPAGAYGDFTANSGSGFTLGVAGSSQPAVYYFQNLTLNSQAQVQLAGPVIVIVANGFNINGAAVGSSTNPAWLTLNVFAGSLTLNSGATVYGYVTVASGTLTINGQLVGGAACDRLTINGNGHAQLINPTN